MSQILQLQFNELIEDSTNAGQFAVTTHPRNNISLFKDIQATRQRATIRRWKVTENLDRYLIEFEANFIKAGGKMLWARDVAEAQTVIADILARNFVKEVYTFGTGLLNEIELAQCLIGEDIKTSAINNEEALTSVMIADASFFVADPGVVVVNNVNHNFQAAYSKSRCVIAVAAITDVLPNFGDLSLFIPLRAAYENNGNRTSTTLLAGPRPTEGGEQNNDLYLLIIDNGRSNLLADKAMRQSTWCINCGACNAVCPVTATIGNKEGVYEGPVKAVQMPYLKDFEDHQYLTRASSLCGACTRVCPVHINLHELFTHNRHKAVALQLSPQKEKWFYLLWKKTMLKRDKFSFGRFKSNRLVMETVYEKVWGTKENLPPFAKKSFNEMWKEKTV